MANLQRCSKCKSEQEFKYFSINKKGQLYKTCDVCREKRAKKATPLKRTDTDFVDDNVSTATPETTEEEEQLPMNTCDTPWLHIYSKGCKIIDTGKWMLFYPNEDMNEKWQLAKQLFRAGQLIGVRSMKCSTAMENPRASSKDTGVIILYSSYSADEPYITKIGQHILAMTGYQQSPYLYYKTDEQTFQGTRATGCGKNYLYRIKVSDGCKYEEITKTPNTVYDWIDDKMDKDQIRQLLGKRVETEEVEFIVSLSNHQIRTMASFHWNLDGLNDNVDGTLCVYSDELAHKYVLDYGISPTRVLRLYKKLANDGMPYLAVYSNLSYIKEFILNFDGRHASLVEYGKFCEDVIGVPPELDEPHINEKYVIVMDCETNGLMGQYGAKPNSKNLNLFPRVVQFSWGLYTESGEQMTIKDFIIKPDGWTMKGSEKIHGISLDRANKEGVDIKDVLAMFKNDIDNHCLKLVCHNVDFDKLVVASEFLRANIPITDVDTYCTMKETADFCKLYPRRHGQYKWPKLEELYRILFNETMRHQHNSYYDVVNCARCYFAVKDLDL